MMSRPHAFEHAFELALQKMPDTDAQSTPPGMVFHPASAIDDKRCWATNTVASRWTPVCASKRDRAAPVPPPRTHKLVTERNGDLDSLRVNHLVRRFKLCKSGGVLTRTTYARLGRVRLNFMPVVSEQSSLPDLLRTGRPRSYPGEK